MTGYRVASLLGCCMMQLLAAGCLSHAGSHPGYITCAGKGAITGTGYFGAAAGIGGSANNSFTLTADCGPAFTFSQGPLPAPPAPPK
jgi:hypothetical protein